MITREFGPAAAGKYGYVGGVQGGFLVFKREVVDPASPRFGQSVAVGWFASEAEATALIADLDPVTEADMASTWAPFAANVEGYEFSFDNEVQTLDNDWYWHSPDEVFDGVCPSMLAQRSSVRPTSSDRVVVPVEPETFRPGGLCPDRVERVIRRSSRSADQFDADREMTNIRLVQECGDSDAFLEILADYAALIRSEVYGSAAWAQARNRGCEDHVFSALASALFDAVTAFDVSVEGGSLFGGEGRSPLAFRFHAAARQAMTDVSLPVQVAGQRVSEAFAEGGVSSRPASERALEARDSGNIGDLLRDDSSAFITICGMRFSREQIAEAAARAEFDRVQFLKRQSLPVGEFFWWSFEDQRVRTVVENWMDRLSIVEDDTDADDNDGPATGFAKAHLMSPAGWSFFPSESDAADRVGALLERLSQHQRTVVEALFGLGDQAPSSQEALAARMGVSQQAVQQTLQRALGVMRGEEGVR